MIFISVFYGWLEKLLYKKLNFTRGRAIISITASAKALERNTKNTLFMFVILFPCGQRLC